MENLTIELDKEELQNMFSALMENAFAVLHQNDLPWGYGGNQNTFIDIIRKAIEKNQDEIERILGTYILEIVESEDFRNAVKLEYSGMLARAMLAKIGKGAN